MERSFRRPFEAIDYTELMRAHTPPPEYFETDYILEPEAIEQRQPAQGIFRRRPSQGNLWDRS